MADEIMRGGFRANPLFLRATFLAAGRFLDREIVKRLAGFQFGDQPARPGAAAGPSLACRRITILRGDLSPLHLRSPSSPTAVPDRSAAEPGQLRFQLFSLLAENLADI